MTRSHYWLAGSYLLALAAAWISLPFFADYPVLVQVLLADIVATIVIFGFSLAFANSSYYDPYWSVIPMVIALYFISIGSDANVSRQVMVGTVVCLWGIRLTANFLYTWSGLDHQDWRYFEMREQSGALWQPVNFLGIHLIPTLIVFLGCIPLYYSLTVSGREVNIFDGLALAVGLTSIWLEYQADVELHRFRQTRRSPEAVIDSGLWARCRHPNYLGEIGVWLSIFLFGYSSMGYVNLWMSAGFVAIAVMFIFITIPMIEKKLERDKPAYAEYRQRTLMLLPFSKPGPT